MKKLNKRKVLALFITIIGLCFITRIAFSQEIILSGKAILLGLGAGLVMRYIAFLAR